MSLNNNNNNNNNIFDICDIVMIVVSPNKKIAIPKDQFLKMDPNHFHINFGFKKLESFTQRNLEEYPRIEKFDKEEKCLWDTEEEGEWNEHSLIDVESAKNYKKDLKVQVVMNCFPLPSKYYDQEEFEKEIIPKFKELYEEEFDLRLCFPHTSVGILIHNFFKAKYFVLNCPIKMYKEKISLQAKGLMSLIPYSFPPKQESKKRKEAVKKTWVTIARNFTIDLTNISDEEEEEKIRKEQKKEKITDD